MVKGGFAVVCQSGRQAKKYESIIDKGIVYLIFNTKTEEAFETHDFLSRSLVAMPLSIFTAS